MKMNFFFIISLSICFFCGCSSKKGIPIVREVGEIANIPIELVQNIIGVEDSATKRAKRDLKNSQKKLDAAQRENQNLRHSLKEKEKALDHIRKNLKCIRMEKRGNSILFLPDPDCYDD